MKTTIGHEEAQFFANLAMMKREQGCADNFFPDDNEAGREANRALERVIWCQKNPCSIERMREAEARFCDAFSAMDMI